VWQAMDARLIAREEYIRREVEDVPEVSGWTW
jgi:hypothetical protein